MLGSFLLVFSLDSVFLSSRYSGVLGSLFVVLVLVNLVMLLVMVLVLVNGMSTRFEEIMVRQYWTLFMLGCLTWLSNSLDYVFHHLAKLKQSWWRSMVLWLVLVKLEEWRHLHDMRSIILTPAMSMLFNFLNLLSISFVVVLEKLFLVFNLMLLLQEKFVVLLKLSNFLINFLHTSKQIGLFLFSLLDLMVHVLQMLSHLVDLTLQLANLASEHQNNSNKDDDDEG